MEVEASPLQVEFPDFSCSILQKLNRQRQLGQLCDITVVIQGHRFRAHRAVLAASSPYFCDQVLLKNSVRVVLPDVMLPSVFSSLLQSCYTGTLLLPVSEVVAFLTAASFLQMWHVVDKCTELLEVNPAVLCQKSEPGSACPLPVNSDYGCPSEDSDIAAAAEPGLFSMNFDCSNGEAERGAENSAEDDGSSGPAPDGEDGGSDVAEYQNSKPLYIQPSIMCHKRWIRVKMEKTEQACDGLLAEMELDAAGQEPASPTEDQLGRPLSAGAEENLEANLEESREGRKQQLYDEPLDFYGASMEEFCGDKSSEEPPPAKPGEDPGGAADASELSEGIREETSHSGFAAVVYKLYPCQCGKSFTHKSQRDRHMSMHLGLRPYGCAVCGKKFKMKHHLVGHMKIHTGIKPYECSVCGKRFMWRDSFNRHMSSCARAHQAKCSVTQHATPIC